MLIGSGLGTCLKTLSAKGPVAVVDREAPLLALSETTELRDAADVLWLDDEDPAAVMAQLTEWQAMHDNLPLAPVAIPVYLRLAPDYYGVLTATLKATPKTDFWSRARYPKFRSSKPKVLFFDSNYFLCAEILSALEELDIAHRTVQLDDREKGSGEFIEAILKAAVDFRPDCVLTVNHFGFDREGKLAGLLDDLRLPLASWFVDNPHLILFDYQHPGTDNTAVFTFDSGNLDDLRNKGFQHVHHLPLATDAKRFRPGLGLAAPATWHADVSFVGNSMTKPVAKSLGAAGLPASLHGSYQSIARHFDRSGETRVDRFLRANHPDWYETLSALPTRENRLALESLLTWEATRQYRTACVRATLPHSPLIVGDDGWQDQLVPHGNWHHHQPLDYYRDLPRFYPNSTINFNCTSRQMKGAVNQRIFDVPACGGFILTDYREQMEDLFEPGTEVIAYDEIDEIPALIERFLNAPDSRAAVTKAARKRIRAEHTYTVRLSALLETMRNTFGP